MVDLSPLITSLTKSIAPQDIIAVLALIVGVGMPFVLMWFGIRKLISYFRSCALDGSFLHFADGLTRYTKYRYFRKEYDIAKCQSFKEWYHDDLYYRYEDD